MRRGENEPESSYPIVRIKLSFFFFFFFVLQDFGSESLKLEMTGGLDENKGCLHHRIFLFMSRRQKKSIIKWKKIIHKSLWRIICTFGGKVRCF